MQILPAIDLRGGKCVRLRQGDYSQETVFSDDPVQMAWRWAADGAERLHLVDLDGAKLGKPINHEIVRQIVRAVPVPCQLGGGVRDEQSIRLLLEDIGVDRVIVGTQALKQPEWLKAMAEAFPERVAVGIDAKNGLVATEGWLDVSKTPALVLARRFIGLPLGALIYTNIANDGMMQGVDDETLKDMAHLAEMGFPVIASGGVSSIQDVRRLTDLSHQYPGLVGAIIGRALYEGRIQVADAVAATRLVASNSH